MALAPPYRTVTVLRSADGAELPLGSVVLASSDATVAGLAQLTAVSHRAPWAVPCLTLPLEQESLKPQLLLVTELRDRLVMVRVAGRKVAAEVGSLVAAVRRRPPPAPTMLARWVARRLSSREVEAPLRQQFEEGLCGAPADDARSIASYSRLFSRYGRYTARDWRAVGTLWRAAARRDGGALARLCAHAVCRISGDGGADGQGHLPFRTASKYAARYLGVAYHVTAERLGWEWVLEAALRTAGYV